MQKGPRGQLHQSRAVSLPPYPSSLRQRPPAAGASDYEPSHPPAAAASEMEAGLRLRALGHRYYHHSFGGFKRGGLAAARGGQRRRVGSCSPAFCSRAWREPFDSVRFSSFLRRVSLTCLRLRVCSCSEWEWQWRRGWARGERRGGGVRQEDASRRAGFAAGNCF